MSRPSRVTLAEIRARQARRARILEAQRVRSRRAALARILAATSPSARTA